MDDIPNHVLKDLVELGKLSERKNAERNPVLDKLRPFDRCGRTHANAWISAVGKLDNEQLANLIRGLVLAEESLPGWNGGSVSGIIWAFRAYQRQVPQNANKVADWVLLHSTNNYVPYGTSRAGAKSVVELEAYRTANELRRRECKRRTEAEQYCKKVRELVAQRLQQEGVIFQKAKAEARRALVGLLDGLSIKQRLEHIAWDDEHDLTFYPDNYANATLAEFDSLDDISRMRLISKIKSWHKGCWAELFLKVTK